MLINAIEIFAETLAQRLEQKVMFTNDGTECEVYQTVAYAVREALEEFKRQAKANG